MEKDCFLVGEDEHLPGEDKCFVGDKTGEKGEERDVVLSFASVCLICGDLVGEFNK